MKRILHVMKFMIGLQMSKAWFSCLFLFFIIYLLLSTDSWFFKIFGILLIILIILLIIVAISDLMKIKNNYFRNKRTKTVDKIEMSGDDLLDFSLDNEEELADKEITITLKTKKDKLK